MGRYSEELGLGICLRLSIKLLRSNTVDCEWIDIDKIAMSVLCAANPVGRDNFLPVGIYDLCKMSRRRVADVRNVDEVRHRKKDCGKNDERPLCGARMLCPARLHGLSPERFSRIQITEQSALMSKFTLTPVSQHVNRLGSGRFQFSQSPHGWGSHGCRPHFCSSWR